MGILKRITALAIGAAIMCTAVNTVFAENNNRGDTVNIKIDGSKANTSENFLYRGQGMISCNGSSRLLLDYKEKNPESYDKILEHLYGKNGLKFTHFKVEMGADVNTSSGTVVLVRIKTSAPADSVGAFLTDKRKEVFLYE